MKKLQIKVIIKLLLIITVLLIIGIFVTIGYFMFHYNPHLISKSIYYMNILGSFISGIGISLCWDSLKKLISMLKEL